MYPNHAHPRYLLIGLIAAPFVAFAIYVAWIIVPLIVETVVPAVVRVVTGS
jgi:hypothetical protein